MGKQIKNVRVEHDGDRGCVLWTVGSDRFHVWLHHCTDEPEDTIYKNSIAEHGKPGSYPTRRLTREGSRAAQTMFAEVWATVEENALVAKARAAKAQSMERQRLERMLEGDRLSLEQEALILFRIGDFDKLPELHERYRALLVKLANAMAEVNNAKG
jgi:hypothetical protein